MTETTLTDADGTVRFRGTLDPPGSGGFTGWTEDGSNPANVDSNGADLTVSTLTGNVTGNVSGDVDNGTQVLNALGLDTGGATITSNGGSIDSANGTISSGTTGKVATALVQAVVAGTGTTLGVNSSAKLGFYGATPATRPEVPAIPTAQDVVDALVTLGVVTQTPP